MSADPSNDPMRFLKMRPALVAIIAIIATGILLLVPFMPNGSSNVPDGRPAFEPMPSPGPARSVVLQSLTPPSGEPVHRVSIAQALGRAMGMNPAPGAAVKRASLINLFGSAPAHPSGMKARAMQRINQLSAKFSGAGRGGASAGGSNSRPGARSGRVQSSRAFTDAKGAGGGARAIASANLTSAKSGAAGGSEAYSYEGVREGGMAAGGPIGIKESNPSSIGAPVSQTPAPVDNITGQTADGGPIPGGPKLAPNSGASTPSADAPSLDDANTYISNYSTGPWNAPNGTACNAGSIFSRTTGVDQAHPPKGCASPAGSIDCLNISNHRDFLPSEWLDSTTLQTVVNGSDYPAGRYSIYLGYSSSDIKMIGTATLVDCSPDNTQGCQWGFRGGAGKCTGNPPEPLPVCKMSRANFIAKGPACASGGFQQVVCVCPGIALPPEMEVP
ncbi:MAG: hypothetical protein ACHQ51_04735 [Elusimicrobiota bacterium]